MKKIKYFLLLLILANLIVVTSCTDTYDLHQKYIEDGETIYTNKVDSIVSLPGDSRLQLSGYISNAFNVKEIVVYWNNGENNQVFPYVKSENFTDPLNLIITGLEETTQQFDIYSIDADGNKSIKVTSFGTSYGEVYRSNLEARLLKSFYYAGSKNATIKFNIKSELTRDTEVSYTNLSGEQAVTIIGENEEEGILVNIDITKPVSYVTNYVPTPIDEETGEETSIDQFTSDPLTYIIPTNLEPILNTFTFEATLGGVITSWENTANTQVNLTFQNTVSGSISSNTISTNESAGTYTISPMDSGAQEIEIIISDIYGNAWGKLFTVTPISALDKTSWEVIDFSSEEPKEATWGGGGQAIHAIDGNDATFWHSAWDLTQPDYPHHFTVDMHAEHTITSFEILGRNKNNNRAAGQHEFWGSVDNVNWVLITSYTGELATSTILIDVPTPTVARYFKYIATERGSGDTNYTFLAELSIYAK